MPLQDSRPASLSLARINSTTVGQNWPSSTLDCQSYNCDVYSRMQRQPKIMLIEDDERLARVLEDAIRQKNWTVRTLNNGFQIVTEVGRFEPDLLLLDINMPGLRGDAAARLLTQVSRKAGVRETPIMVLSALDDHRLQTITENIGAIGYIQKAHSIDTVVGQIRDALVALGLVRETA